MAKKDDLKRLQAIAERAKTRISDGTRWIDGVAEAEFKRALTPEVALDLIALCQIPRRKHPKQEPRKPITIEDVWPESMEFLRCTKYDPLGMHHVPTILELYQLTKIRAHIEARLKQLQE